MCKHKFKECSMKGVPLEVIYKELGNTKVRVSVKDYWQFECVRDVSVGPLHLFGMYGRNKENDEEHEWFRETKSSTLLQWIHCAS